MHVRVACHVTWNHVFLFSYDVTTEERKRTFSSFPSLLTLHGSKKNSSYWARQSGSCSQKKKKSWSEIVYETSVVRKKISSSNSIKLDEFLSWMCLKTSKQHAHGLEKSCQTIDDRHFDRWIVRLIFFVLCIASQWFIWFGSSVKMSRSILPPLQVGHNFFL